MNSFQHIFAEEIECLENVISEIPSEEMHIQRCIDLAGIVEWDQSNAGSEIGQMLGPKGVLIFDEITRRIASNLKDESSEELRDYREFLNYLMLVHDLGKYNIETNSYDGSGHEARSGEYVQKKHAQLLSRLNWERGNADLLVHLTRFHSHLGIARLGEVSNVFLEPILDVLIDLTTERKRLLLDFLVVLTCCDAGASGNFETKTYFLDESRITLYDQIATELFEISERFEPGNRSEASTALIERSSSIESTVLRIKRMVTSDNQLTVGDDDVKTALQKVVYKDGLNTRNLALTQFDHGAYVFAPLLTRLSRGDDLVSQGTIEKFLNLLGRLCDGRTESNVIQFRHSFSMKTDLQSANRSRFETLCKAVEQEDLHAIDEILKVSGR